MSVKMQLSKSFSKTKYINFCEKNLIHLSEK